MFMLINNIKRLLSFNKSILISIVLSFGLMYAYSSNDTNNEITFNPSIVIIDEDQTTESKEFISYLKDNGFEVDVVERNLYQNVLVIEKGFSDDIVNDVNITLTYYDGEKSISSLVEYQVNTFHQEKLGNDKLSNIKVDVINYKIHDVNDNAIHSSLYITNYIPYVVYLSSTLVYYVFMKRINRVDYRESLLGISFIRRFISEILAVFIVLLIPIICLVVADTIFNGFTFEKAIAIVITQLLAITNIYLLALLINALTNKKQAIIAIATVIQLLMGATSGSWVPYEFLPTLMQYIGKINPLYWLNKISYSISTGTTVIEPLLVFIAINIVIAIATIIASKKIKYTENIASDKSPLS